MSALEKETEELSIKTPRFKVMASDALLYWGMVKSIRLNKVFYDKVINQLRFWEEKLLPSEWLKTRIIEIKELNEELKPDGTGK